MFLTIMRCIKITIKEIGHWIKSYTKLNLWNEELTLDLYHNYIEKIEGLDKLTQLTWLNLGDNQKEKIEGLDK